MTAEELEDMAFRGAPMPEDMRSQADILLFQSFRNLYDFAKRTGMPREQGAREKAEILSAYKINKFLEDLQEDTCKLWKRIEIAAAQYAKEPRLETADALYYSLYRVSRKQTEEEKERLPFQVVKEEERN